MSIHGATTLANAYIDALKLLIRHGRAAPPVTDPLSPASRFGEAERPALELLAFQLRVGDATSALVAGIPWQADLPYAAALLLWTVAGSDDIAWLAYYHPEARLYADDAAHSSGAFGYRLRGGPIDQFQAVLQRLREDSGTRRAAAVVFAPDDAATTSREVPCCLAIQYFIRDGRLHAVTTMRAQHALKVLQYDAFVFMCIQCLLAAELGVSTGDYYHISGTFHIFEEERGLAEHTAAATARSVTVAPVPVGLDAYLECVSTYERELRQAALSGDVRAAGALIETGLGTSATGLVQLSQLAWSLRACDVIGAEMQTTRSRVERTLERAYGI